MIYEGTVAKSWTHVTEDGDALLCFTLEGTPDHAFWGPDRWEPLLAEALELRTGVRVMASDPEIVKCGDPHCGGRLLRRSGVHERTSRGARDIVPAAGRHRRVDVVGKRGRWGTPVSPTACG